jgi:16S rRNA (guanine966-N2)-methyltransferase
MRGQVRIIGGEWRGRKLSIPQNSEVRPTPDRVRETLFNWLAPHINGACCLDLFAGSGALGFEALSRGASEVVMVDQSPVVVKLLISELHLFKATKGVVLQAKIPQHWPVFSKIFDIVFLDPPYKENLLLPSCFALEEKGLLADTAYIYLESGKDLLDDEFPPGWEIIKRKKAGQVGYYLVKRTGVPK